MAEPHTSNPVPAGFVANEEQIPPLIGGACFAALRAAQPCCSAGARAHHSSQHGLHLLRLGLRQHSPLLLQPQGRVGLVGLAFSSGELAALKAELTRQGAELAALRDLVQRLARELGVE